MSEVSQVNRPSTQGDRSRGRLDMGYSGMPYEGVHQQHQELLGIHGILKHFVYQKILSIE